MRGNPQHAIGIFIQIGHVVVAQAVGIVGIMLVDCKVIPIVFVQAALCSNPHKTLAVLQNCINDTIRQAILGRQVCKPNGGAGVLSLRNAGLSERYLR